MKNCRKNMLKSSKGITLIALVVTIIVLLILAGISISMLSGDNSILQRATDAKEKTERASVVEQARTDVLGYQTENRGGDLEKTQLKSVLDTYFKDVPTVENLPEGEDLLNLELTTLDKYGTHQIKVSEIYNGNISGSSKIKAATLYEDKAGDEEGATDGKIHIGDYVNYNPIAQGDTGTETKYKYESSNDYTGITEAIAASKVTFTDDSQDFTAKSNLKWQVIGIDEENILITTETPIIPDNPVSMQVQTGPSSYTTLTGYGLYGAKSYINVSSETGERNEINNISQIYKYGKGSDVNKARGMTIEDVNKITGVTTNGTTITPNGIDLTGYYGNSYSFASGWSPSAWISKGDSATPPGISGNATGYQYLGSDTKLKTANSSIRKKLIFGENSSLKMYWLSSRAVIAGPSLAQFGPGALFNNAAGPTYSTFLSNGTEDGCAFGMCPVIYLDSNVSLTSAGTTNNIHTWNID